MESIVNNMGKKNYTTKIIVCLCIAIFIFGSFTFFFNNNSDKNFIFVLNGEEMDSIMVCENEWNYDDLDFLPCLINGTFGGLFQQTINYSLSPQENCDFWGGEFTGFNVYNETRSKEIYDELLPSCFEFKKEEVSYSWLNSSGCLCFDKDKNSEFSKNCKKYNCGGGLVVLK